MEQSEVTQLVLLVTEHGASEVVKTVRDIAEGMADDLAATRPDATPVSMVERMWREISAALNPVVNKTAMIERKYKGMVESRQLIRNAIKDAAKQAGDEF